MLPLLPALFFFGSSFLDVGTNKFLNNTTPSNFLPYGETYFHHATGRNSDGLILSDLLELKMGFPFLPPFLQPGANFSLGANFASAGSGLFDDTCIGCENGPVVPLSHQISQFQKLLCDHPGNLQSKLPESLIVVNVGTNDLIQKTSSPYELLQHPNETVGRMVGRFAEFIKVLYESGARKFLIVGLTPLGSTPGFRLTPVSKLVNASVRRYNAGIRNTVVKFAAEHDDFKFIFFNAYKRFADMIRKPSKYGFTETEKSCYVAPNQNTARFLCEDTQKYLFWDSHPTERGYEILVDDIWRGDSSHVFPVNLQTFLDSSRFFTRR